MRIETFKPVSIHNSDFGLEKKNGTGFYELLKDAIQDVNQTQKAADIIAEKFAVGEIQNIHEVTIAAEQAKLALDLTVAIRNKVVEAYKEIMRLQF